jgi:hypothetical protein
VPIPSEFRDGRQTFALLLEPRLVKEPSAGPLLNAFHPYNKKEVKRKIIMRRTDD